MNRPPPESNSISIKILIPEVHGSVSSLLAPRPDCLRPCSGGDCHKAIIKSPGLSRESHSTDSAAAQALRSDSLILPSATLPCRQMNSFGSALFLCPPIS